MRLNCFYWAQLLEGAYELVVAQKTASGLEGST